MRTHAIVSKVCSSI